MENILHKEQNETQQKRDAIAKKVVELQAWCGKNKTHHHYARKKEEWNNAMEELRALNALNKNRGFEQQITMFKVVRDSICSEQYNRIKQEAQSRLNGNPDKVISILRTEDEEIIEKYKPLELKYNKLREKLNLFTKEIDNMMLSTSGSHSPEQWNNIQNYNKQILKMKREVNLLLSDGKI